MVFLSGYTEEEKLEIAVRHIISRTVKDNGLNKVYAFFHESGCQGHNQILHKRSGVRELERQIAKVCRKAAVMSVSGKHKNLKVTPRYSEELLGKSFTEHEMALAGDQVGIATGLAWTPSGGDALSIEVELMEGTVKSN
jgi:ATP-dependent Lon protease